MAWIKVDLNGANLDKLGQLVVIALTLPSTLFVVIFAAFLWKGTPAQHKEFFDTFLLLKKSPSNWWLIWIFVFFALLAAAQHFALSSRIAGLKESLEACKKTLEYCEKAGGTLEKQAGSTNLEAGQSDNIG